MVNGDVEKSFYKQSYRGSEIWVREQTGFPLLLEVLFFDAFIPERRASVVYVPYSSSYTLRMNGKDLKPRACGFFKKEEAFEAAKIFAVSGMCGG